MNPCFKNLSINGWRQFHNVSMDFHPRLTVITGANGAGKSSLLGLLTQNFGWPKYFLGTPLKKRANGAVQFMTGVRNKIALDENEHQVGTITYANGNTSYLRTVSEGIQYTVSIHNRNQVLGTFITSHRAPPFFQQVDSISIYAMTPDNAYSAFQGETIQRSMGNNNGPGATFRIKEALISMAHFGAEHEFSPGDVSAIQTLKGFVLILKKILPPTLGFTDLSFRGTEVVLETDTGNFVIDAASGGITALIDISWQIYTYSLTTVAKNSKGFVVIIDEPENHLHPSMQRSLLKNLIDTFPTAQFIVATHSPFMVSSVQDSAVYVLRYTQPIDITENDHHEDGYTPTKLVCSELLDVVNRAGSASDILRDVLGVPITVPEWVEVKLDALIARFRDKELNSNTLGELRSQMAELGFGELYPRALSQLLEEQ